MVSERLLLIWLRSFGFLIRYAGRFFFILGVSSFSSRVAQARHHTLDEYIYLFFHLNLVIDHFINDLTVLAIALAFETLVWSTDLTFLSLFRKTMNDFLKEQIASLKSRI